MTICMQTDQRETLFAKLTEGLESLELRIDEMTRNRLLDYLDLLEKWNHVYNLTAIREKEKMVSMHLLDSIAILKHLPSGPYLDVGTGAGLPGIPLATILKDETFSLVDIVQKKCAFLRQAKAELALDNVTVMCVKIDQWHPTQHFACIVARAYAEIPKFLESCKHLLAPGGQFAAMKGRLPEQELANLPSDYEIQKVIPLTIPEVDAERHLVLIGKK
jgi:16S rRNA (guanine527-N7)-methyltransferase